MSVGRGGRRAQVRRLLLLLAGTALIVAAGTLVSGTIAPDVSEARQVADTPVDDGGAMAAAGDVTSVAAAETTVRGTATNDTAGTSVASVGDVNGDGGLDLAVGVPGNDAGGDDAGAVALFDGPVPTGDLDLGEADALLVGQSPGDRAGHAVAGAGDLDGDGYADVVVGAPGAGEADAGAAYVVFGGPDGPAGTVTLGETGVTLGGAPGDRAGWAVAGANETGGPVLVGAPRHDAAGRDAGGAFVVSNETLERAGTPPAAGANESPTVTLAADADATLVGEHNRSNAGWALAHAGDVTGDGEADFVVGARKTNTSVAGDDATDAGSTTTDGGAANAVSGGDAPDDGVNAGAAYVVSGPVDGTQSLGSADWRLYGERANDQAGYAVAGLGDVDGDGVDDVAVGAPFHNASELAPNAGAVYVFSGGENRTGATSVGAANRTHVGEFAGNRAGWAVAGAGPTCGDRDDVLVGAPGYDGNGTDTGAAYLVAGEANASDDRTLTLSDAQAIFVGAQAGDGAGRTVAGLGDVTEDTITDVVVGAPFADVGAAADAGAAHVLARDCPEDADETAPDALADAGEPVAPEPADESTDPPISLPELPLGSASPAETPEQTATDTPTEPEPVTATQTATETAVPTETDSDTPDATEAPTGTATQTATATPTGTATRTATPTQTETPSTQTETTADGQVEPIEATMVCERSGPYLWNPNDYSATVTIDGPDGEETHGLGPGIDVGGPSPASHRTPSMTPGEYTVTAVDEDGTEVPVNGESVYTTTVTECPVTSLSFECLDDDTAQASFQAEHLTGRHAVPVTLSVSSPNPDVRRELTVQPDADGNAARTFEVSDAERVRVTATYDAENSPSRLGSERLDPGACDGTGGPPADENTRSAGDEAETPASEVDQPDAEPDESADEAPQPAPDAPAGQPGDGPTPTQDADEVSDGDGASEDTPAVDPGDESPTDTPAAESPQPGDAGSGGTSDDPADTADTADETPDSDDPADEGATESDGALAESDDEGTAGDGAEPTGTGADATESGVDPAGDRGGTTDDGPTADQPVDSTGDESDPSSGDGSTGDEAARTGAEEDQTGSDETSSDEEGASADAPATSESD